MAQVKPSVHINRLVRDQRNLMQEQVVALTPLESSSLNTAEINTAAMKIQQEHCVTVKWPGQKEGLITEKKLRNGSVQLTCQPILTCSADAVVVPTTLDMSHVKGLGKGIAKVEEDLTSQCQEYICKNGFLKSGNAVAFAASKLKKVRHVVYLAFSSTFSDDDDQKSVLRDSVINSLRCAENRNAVSVVMPAIGDNLYSMTDDDKARAILGAIRDYLENDSSTVRDVIISLIDPALIAVYQNAFDSCGESKKSESAVEKSVTNWLFKNDRDNFQSYLKEAETFIEGQYQNDPLGICLLKPSTSPSKYTYMINFQTMTQTNVQTKKQRPIRRKVVDTAQAQWLWENAFGELEPYSESTSKALEKAKNTKQRHVHVETGSAVSYTCDLSRMIQTHAITGVVSKISRVVVSKKRPPFSERLRGRSAGSDYLRVSVRGDAVDVKAAAAKF